MVRWGAIEAGGTKIVCAVGEGDRPTLTSTSPPRLTEIRIPTRSPGETLAQILAFFTAQQQQGPLEALGIGCFGPLDLNPRSSTYGYLLDTPKPGWRQINLLGELQKHLSLPIALDTDVNAAALGEQRWGAAQGLDTFIYLTVGTGIGGGAIVNGKPLHGLLHPEMGHILLPHSREQDPFPGCCPFHQNCLEGLASGTALQARWGQSAEQLPSDHPAWDLEAQYLAGAIATFTFTLSPQRIILGGGVMQQQPIWPKVHRQAQAMLASYLAVPAVLAQIEQYIVPPQLGNQAGILGAIALAQDLGTTA